MRTGPTLRSIGPVRFSYEALRLRPLHDADDELVVEVSRADLETGTGSGAVDRGAEGAGRDVVLRQGVRRNGELVADWAVVERVHGSRSDGAHRTAPAGSSGRPA